MRKKDQEVFRHAVAYAASGKCKDWEAVLAKLVENGYRRAPELLDSARLRAVIDLQCKLGR